MNFSCRYAGGFFDRAEMNELRGAILEAHNRLHSGTGEGSDYTGWLCLPETYNREETERIKKAAKDIREKADVLIVIGIGGSYLGAKAAIRMLTSPLKPFCRAEGEKCPKIFFAGHNINGPYVKDLLEIAENSDFAVNVISKSGTTTEPAIAFRFFKDLLERKYGKEGARERIYVTTDKEKGALFSLAETEGYEKFVVPDNVGGRYSVLTPVGLLPIAVAGIDIDAMLRGAKDEMDALSVPELDKNPCYRYAAARNILYRMGKTTEVLANFDGRLQYFAEWWKQLYGESEGKDGKGIFPAAVNFSTDLHSVGQYIQDGLRNIFETVIYVKKPDGDVTIPKMEENIDGLQYLEGRNLSEVNEKAFLGAIMAHKDGGVPCLVIEMEELDAYNFGKVVYFFEKACAISGYILGVNPFDQPGVEAYKNNMFALLGKPGFEEEGIALRDRIKNL